MLFALWVRSYWRPVTVPKTSGHTVVVSRGKLQIDRGFVRTNRRIVDTVNFQLDDGTQRFGVQGPSEVMETGFAVPMVILLLLPVGGLVAPWLTYRRFSLLTLLIAITLVAVVLGLCVIS